MCLLFRWSEGVFNLLFDGIIHLLIQKSFFIRALTLFVTFD